MDEIAVGATKPLRVGRIPHLTQGAGEEKTHKARGPRESFLGITDCGRDADLFHVLSYTYPRNILVPFKPTAECGLMKTFSRSLVRPAVLIRSACRTTDALTRPFTRSVREHTRCHSFSFVLHAHLVHPSFGLIPKTVSTFSTQCPSADHHDGAARSSSAPICSHRSDSPAVTAIHIWTHSCGGLAVSNYN